MVVAPVGGRNKLRPSRMGSRHLGGGDADERADSPFYEVCPFLGGAVYVGAAEIRRRLNTIRTLAETLALAESFPASQNM